MCVFYIYIFFLTHLPFTTEAGVTQKKKKHFHHRLIKFFLLFLVIYTGKGVTSPFLPKSHNVAMKISGTQS